MFDESKNCSAAEASTGSVQGLFIAINTITCHPSYAARFEALFESRKGAIDRVPGFIRMMVLRPRKPHSSYLVVSEWENAGCFQAWVGSPEFHEGHKRAFEDLAEAKARGDEPPMVSEFATYEVFAR